MRLSSLLSTSLSCCLASVAMAQTGHMSDELRQEIRNLIREEIHAAMQHLHAPADKAPEANKNANKQTISFGHFGGDPAKAEVKDMKVHFRTNDATEGKQDAKKTATSFGFLSPQGTTTSKNVMKAFQMVDGKLVTLDDVTVMGKPKSGSRVMTLMPAKDGATAHQIEFVVTEQSEKQALAECCKALEAANECCEAVQAATKGEGECCAEGKCAECVVEVEAAPIKVKAKKAKAKKGGKKSKKAKSEKIDEVTELKISEVLEQLAR